MEVLPKTVEKKSKICFGSGVKIESEKYVVDPDELDELHGPVKIIFVLLRKVKVYNFIRRMKVKVYNLVRHTWLIVADDLLMLGLSSFRRKLFDFQAFHNQAHIINLSGIIIYFCGTYYLYAMKHLMRLVNEVAISMEEKVMMVKLISFFQCNESFALDQVHSNDP